MQILKIEDGKRPKAVKIHAVLGAPEYEQLLGSLDNLCVFATKTITEKSSVVKTGARHSFAKYALIPVALRRKIKAEEYDFENMKCGAVRYKDAVYLIFGVGRKDATGNEKEKSERKGL